MQCFLTPSGANPNAKKSKARKNSVEPITKTEVDNSKRKLNFVEWEPEAEEGAINAKDEDLMVESLLENVTVPNLCSAADGTGRMSRPTDDFVGSPAVLGIHRNNGFSKKPQNKEERIEMKLSSQKALPANSKATHRRVASNKLAHDFAPLAIKKKSVVKPLNKSASERKLNTRTSNRMSTKDILASVRKDVKFKKTMESTPKKPIRGMQLYRFTESARTLRSAATKNTSCSDFETPKKAHSPSKS